MIKLKKKAVSSVYGESAVKQLAIEFTLTTLKERLIERPLLPLIREPARAIEFILDAEEAEAAAAVRALVDAKVLEPIDSDKVTYKVNSESFELVKSLEGVRELFIQEEGEEAGLKKLEFILDTIRFRQIEPTPLTLIAFGEAYIFDEFSQAPSLLSQAWVELYSPWLKRHLSPETIRAVPAHLELPVVLEAQQAILKPSEPFVFAHERPSPVERAVKALKKKRVKFNTKPGPQPSRAKTRAVRGALEDAGIIVGGYINIRAFEPLSSLAALKVFYTTLVERQAQDELKEKRKKVFSGFSNQFIEEAFIAIREKEAM